MNNIVKIGLSIIIFFTSVLSVQAQKTTHGLTDEKRDSLKQKTAAGSVVNYSAQDHMGTPRGHVVDKGWIGIKGGTSEIKIWGWVQAAVFTDLQEYYLNSSQEFSAGLVAVPNNGLATSGFDASSSRLFLQTRHWLKSGNAVEVMFIMDAGGDATISWAVPRIRQFYVTINNLTFGAANGTFANFNTWPGYFDRGAPGAFPLARKPLIRYAIPLNKEEKTRNVITVGAEWANAEVANATMRVKVPDLVVRYDYSPKWGNMMLGVIARDLNAVSEDDTLPGSDEKWVWGGQFSGLWHSKSLKNKIRWIAMYGNAISGYTWDTGFEPGNTGFYDPAEATLNTMDGFGFTVSYEQDWTKKLYSMFSYAYVDIANIEGQPDNAFNKTNTYIATLRYNPWENFYVAGEYMYGNRTNYNNESAYDNRLNLVLRYMFNH